MKTYQELIQLFKKVNECFLSHNQDLLRANVSERTLCGALMLEIHDLVANDITYEGYYADVEYNRNGGMIKTVKKTITGIEERVVRINCDLILHSRGNHPEQDNLIAIEMKKSSAPLSEKAKDRDRLCALTMEPMSGDVYSYDGQTLPVHVCDYVLGIYYEIDYRKEEILLEYYRRGEKAKSHRIPWQSIAGKELTI